VNNETPGSSETLIAIYQTKSCHDPQDHNFGKGLVGPSASLFNLRKYLPDFDEMFFQVYGINNNNNNKFNCNWAVARWQWLLCVYINKKKEI